MDFVTTLGALAAIATLFLMLPSFRPPYLKNVSFTPGTGSDYRSKCMNLRFTFATSFLWCSIESISVPGYKLRSREFCVVEPHCAVDCIESAFTASPAELEKSFSFACFPVNPPEHAHLKIRIKVFFIHKTFDHPLS